MHIYNLQKSQGTRQSLSFLLGSSPELSYVILIIASVIAKRTYDRRNHLVVDEKDLPQETRFKFSINIHAFVVQIVSYRK